MVGRDLLYDSSTDDSSHRDDRSNDPALLPPVQRKLLAPSTKERPAKKPPAPKKALKITSKKSPKETRIAAAERWTVPTLDYESDSSIDLFPEPPARIFIPKLKVWIELCDGNLIFPRFIFGYGAVLQNKQKVMLLPSGPRGAVKVVPGESYEVVQLLPQQKGLPASAAKICQCR